MVKSIAQTRFTDLVENLQVLRSELKTVLDREDAKKVVLNQWQPRRTALGLLASPELLFKDLTTTDANDQKKIASIHAVLNDHALRVLEFIQTLAQHRSEYDITGDPDSFSVNTQDRYKLSCFKHGTIVRCSVTVPDGDSYSAIQIGEDDPSIKLETANKGMSVNLLVNQNGTKLIKATILNEDLKSLPVA